MQCRGRQRFRIRASLCKRLWTRECILEGQKVKVAAELSGQDCLAPHIGRRFT